MLAFRQEFSLVKKEANSHFLSKLLKNVQLTLKGKTTKSVNLVHAVQNVKKNVTTNFQKLNLDSQWRIFSEISNCKIIKGHGNMSFFILYSML